MLNSHIPSGPLRDKWRNFKDHCPLVSPNNKKKHTILVVGTGLAGASARQPWQSWATGSKAFAFKTPRAGPTALPPRGASTPAKTTPTTATASGGCSTTPSRGATTAPAKPMCIAWRNQQQHHRPVRCPGGALCPGIWGPVLDNRSFGGALVSRTFYARGQTGPAAAAGGLQRHDAHGAGGGH
jgi:succinate dehydrogenase / fumarate reductase flavoprotein subunit